MINVLKINTREKDKTKLLKKLQKIINFQNQEFKKENILTLVILRCCGSCCVYIKLNILLGAESVQKQTLVKH